MLNMPFYRAPEATRTCNERLANRIENRSSLDTSSATNNFKTEKNPPENETLRHKNVYYKIHFFFFPTLHQNTKYFKSILKRFPTSKAQEKHEMFTVGQNKKSAPLINNLKSKSSRRE
jgi:hypothetical protein